MGYVADRSLLDTTIEILRHLNDEQLEAIHSVAKAFASSSGDDDFFKPQTEEELVARIDASLADIKAGRYEDAEAVAEKLRAKYGL